MKTKANQKIFAGLIFLSAVILTGCAKDELSNLDRTSYEGSRFSIALAKEYSRIFHHEREAFQNENTASYYAKKAQLAAKGEGEYTLPENPDDLTIPTGIKPFARVQRLRLIGALENYGRLKEPETAASAQAYFDEWLLFISEKRREAEIAKARSSFERNLSRLEKALAHHNQLADDKHKSTESCMYRVNFDYNKSAIRKESYELLKNIPLLTFPDTQIKLLGHTDACGRYEHNVTLSHQRAQALKNYLIHLGIKAQQIIARGEGIAKDSKLYDPKNRNAIIIVD
jgi:outer membrane protein OmpA-like peptidoglycan-associated protein